MPFSKNRIIWRIKLWSLLVLSFLFLQCVSQSSPEQNTINRKASSTKLFTGANQLSRYVPILRGKRVGLVVNQTSRIGMAHIVDTLLNYNVNVVKLFSPEHGIRGNASRGEKIKDGKDIKTGIPIVSLYGKKRKPLPEDLAGVDYMVFDIQDIGVRFYTYISTLTLVMEACAKNKIPLLILDRPNPNGHYVDGPMMTAEYKSFVGMHEIPVVHGMTIAEYGQMVNGEGWLKEGVKCNLKVIPCKGYNHRTVYDLPIKPSPNLPNLRSIYLYPALCFFEGTKVSVGRGTQKQFQILGYPGFDNGNVEFRPISREGAKNPLYEDQICHGIDLSIEPAEYYRKDYLDLALLKWFYDNSAIQEDFFSSNLWIDKLSGSKALREQIIAGWSIDEIYASWQKELSAFKLMRKKYLLYEDFE